MPSPRSVAPRRPAPSRRGGPRAARTGVPVRLDEGRPAVTLTRTQSGIGHLRCELVGPVGELLRLGCVHELDQGAAIVIADEPPSATAARPGIPVQAARGEARGRSDVVLDLRQIPILRRLLLYGMPRTAAGRGHDGAIIISTVVGPLLEVPVSVADADGRPMALATIYNVAGELVVRREAGPAAGSVRELAAEFGFVLPY